MSREGERQIDYPGTMIQFILDKKSEVKLSIYNIPGEEITVLFKGILEVESHKRFWDAQARLSVRRFRIKGNLLLSSPRLPSSLGITD